MFNDRSFNKSVECDFSSSSGRAAALEAAQWMANALCNRPALLRRYKSVAGVEYYSPNISELFCVQLFHATPSVDQFHRNATTAATNLVMRSSKKSRGKKKRHDVAEVGPPHSRPVACTHARYWRAE